MIHPLLWNAQAIDKDSDFLKRLEPTTMLLHEGPAVQITTRILKKFPDLFNNVETLMTAPVDFCFGKTVTATSQNLKALYSLELAMDNRAMMGHDTAEDYLYDILAGEIGAELALKKAVLQAEGKIMCPYHLVIPYRAMDDNTFAPSIKFRTRYGIYTPES